jgi:alpha-amylase
VQIVSVFSNQGTKGGKYTLSVGDGFAPGIVVVEVLGCTKATADAKGNITVDMGAGEPRVFFLEANMNGSGLCGFPKQVTQTNASSNSTGSSKKHSDAGQLQASVITIIFGVAIFGAVCLLG